MTSSPISASPLRHLAEGRRVQSGRARGDDHAVERVLADVVDDLLLGRIRAGEHRSPGHADSGLALDGVDHLRDVDVVGDVPAAVADVDADLALASLAG